MELTRSNLALALRNCRADFVSVLLKIKMALLTYWLRPRTMALPTRGPPVRNQSQMLFDAVRSQSNLRVSGNQAHFMYWPRLAGSGYPRATAPSEAQKRPALELLAHSTYGQIVGLRGWTHDKPQATAPTRTNHTFP